MGFTEIGKFTNSNSPDVNAAVPTRAPNEVALIKCQPFLMYRFLSNAMTLTWDHLFFRQGQSEAVHALSESPIFSAQNCSIHAYILFRIV